MEFTKDIQFSDELKANETVGITYFGNLFKNGSESVTMVYGFGENWEHTTEQNMEKTEIGFKTNIQMKNNFDTFNFCFRNSNYEWDNNQTCNYISAIKPAVETTDDCLDSKSILAFLDTLLEENLNGNTEGSENTEKQELLNNILSENTNELVTPVSTENFNMDELVEKILNPVINCEVVDDINEELGGLYETGTEQGINNVFEAEQLEENSLLDTLKKDLEENVANLSNNQFSVEKAETTEGGDLGGVGTDLTVTPSNEENFLVSPRKLRRFYLFRKKIKLALYKAIVVIPKILSGEFGEDRN